VLLETSQGLPNKNGCLSIHRNCVALFMRLESDVFWRLEPYIREYNGYQGIRLHHGRERSRNTYVIRVQEDMNAKGRRQTTG